MKAFIFAILIVGAYAQEDEKVEIEGAQFGMMNPMMMNQMNPMMMNQMNPMMGMGGMGGMGGMQMGGMQMGGAQGYQTNYNMPCSNSCGCARTCVPMMPCNCVCPPRCPPQTTPTPEVEVPNGPVCENGAPSDHYPECCFNGGRGRFCCTNNANNLHCCENGANNPWCSLPTEAPVQAPPGGGNDDCNRCQPCQPCMPWTPCQPCAQPCQQRCFGRK